LSRSLNSAFVEKTEGKKVVSLFMGRRLSEDLFNVKPLSGFFFEFEWVF
jgi:hypothetical protein